MMNILSKIRHTFRYNIVCSGNILNTSIPVRNKTMKTNMKHKVFTRYTVGMKARKSYLTEADIVQSKKLPSIKNFGLVWNAPDRVKIYAPDFTGDLETHIEPDDLEPAPKYFMIKDEIKACSPAVQDLCSHSFHLRISQENLNYYRLREKVKQHDYDNYSSEVKVAKLTAQIRFNQWYILTQKHIETLGSKRSGARRNLLVSLFHRRRYILEKMRLNDYKRFEWLLEKLNILYRLKPTKDTKAETRDICIQTLVEEHCDRMKERKMLLFQNKLEKAKVLLKEENIKIHRVIASYEKEIGRPISVELPEGVFEKLESSSKEVEKIKVPIEELGRQPSLEEIQDKLDLQEKSIE